MGNLGPSRNLKIANPMPGKGVPFPNKSPGALSNVGEANAYRSARQLLRGETRLPEQGKVLGGIRDQTDETRDLAGVLVCIVEQ